MGNFNKLIHILEDQTIIYKDLLNISKNKKDVIIEGKVHELENITKVEQAILLNMGSLEEQLEKVVDGLSKDLSIKESEITLSVLLSYLEGEQKAKLEKQRDNIFNIIKELDHMNKLNSQLIKSSLDYINFSVNLFSNVNTDSNGSYEQSGDIRGSKKSFFDVKL